MISFSATYYDGRSTRQHAVVVRATAGQPVRLEGLEPPLEVALTDVRISPRLGNTPRALGLPGGAQCETLDNDAVDALARLAGRGAGSTLVHHLESRWRWALAALAAVAIFVAVGFKWGIPLAARHVAMNLPDELVYDLGRSTLGVLDRTLFSPSQLPEARRAELRSTFDRAARQYPELPLVLQFRHAGFPNAFALPNGTVVVTDELVELAENDDQILSVLAHEIGHVHHRHGLRMALESSSVALVASVTLGDASHFAALFSALPTLYANAHYSRTRETEADTFALQFLDRNGIARHHFADILTLLQRDLGGEEHEGAFTHLASHPAMAERVRRFRE